MNHNCLEYLTAKAKDGEIRSCPGCKAIWVFTKDERQGNYWLPHMKNVHDKDKRAKERQRLRTAAQKVWYK